jgi:hypothetical protein
MAVVVAPMLGGCSSPGSTDHGATPDASHDARSVHDAGIVTDTGTPSDALPNAIPFDGGSNCYPPCLASLFASCQPAGACTESAGNSAQCYANGVKIVLDLVGTNHEQSTFTKGGKACFVQDYVGIGGTATTSVTSAVTTYTGPDGSTIATEHDVFTGNAPTSTVTCGGVTYALSPESPACEDSDGGVMCVTGTCM